VTNSIGGALDYRRLAELHKPRDELILADEARKLRAQGLTDRDIGSVLRLDQTAVRRLIGREGAA
jgi:hypothetical protein